MKMPISVNENGDVTNFRSLLEAEKYLEPIDVERGEYIVTDGEGRELLLSVYTVEIPMFWGLWKSLVRKVRIEAPSEDC